MRGDYQAALSVRLKTKRLGWNNSHTLATPHCTNTSCANIHAYSSCLWVHFGNLSKNLIWCLLDCALAKCQSRLADSIDRPEQSMLCQANANY